MSFSCSRSWNVRPYKVDFFVFSFSSLKITATTTNLFINGCSLHGSHQVIILALEILMGPWSAWVALSRKCSFFFYWMTLIKASWEETAVGSYLLVLRIAVENIEGWHRFKNANLSINEPLVKPRFYSPPPPLFIGSSSSFRIVR